MSWLWLILCSVALLRLGELFHAKQNTAKLLARGGYETGAGPYPAIVALHAAWLASMFVLVPRDAEPYWILIAFFVLLQAARLWVIASLGPYWTTRVITVPGAPLVRRGPYRWFRHPNYLVVILEIAVLPLAFGAWGIALLFSVLNAALLVHRIRVEERALAARRQG